MDALLFALALEVSLLQMKIVEGSAELRSLSWKSLNKREKIQQEFLIRDRETVKEVLRRTLIELAESGDWSPLQEAINAILHKASSGLSTRMEHARLKNTFEEITVELETNRNQWILELRNADFKVAFLRDNIKDEALNANTRIGYSEKWLCARAESRELRQRRTPQPAPRADHEERVHEELVKTLHLQTNEREELSEQWRRKYSDDTASMNQKLADMRQQLQGAIARRTELQKTFDLHSGEIRSWLTFKRERAARLAREARVRYSATLIQAWWRGVMVRRALGAFRFLRNVKKSATKSKKK